MTDEEIEAFVAKYPPRGHPRRIAAGPPGALRPEHFYHRADLIAESLALDLQELLLRRRAMRKAAGVTREQLRLLVDAIDPDAAARDALKALVDALLAGEESLSRGGYNP